MKRSPTATWDCVFDNMMDGTCHIVSQNGWKFEDVLVDLGHRLCDLHHQDFLIQCKSVADIHRAHREGRIAWVPVLEGAAPIENELDRIDVLYGLGVRMMGVTYSESNALGSGLKEDNDGGLTKFGKQAVRRMNQVGMLIDCSHAGPQTTLDTVKHSEKTADRKPYRRPRPLGQQTLVQRRRNPCGCGERRRAGH